MEINKIYHGDSLAILKTFTDGCINCCVTSPPYWGLRDYGNDAQLGLEDTPEQFIKNMVDVFREVKRTLKDDGTLWLNIGDSYAGSGKGPPGNISGDEHSMYEKTKPYKSEYIKPKDLIGIPWMLAFALREDGWYLRQDIIWSKPNPMPESVTDRCTKSHEYIFLFSKYPKYYYDSESIKTPLKESSINRLSQNIDCQNGSDRVPNKINGNMKAVGQFVGGKKHKNLQENGQSNHTFHKTRNSNGQEWESKDGMANKKSVWTVATMPFKESHFATFPEKLIVDCIKAGCPENGIVLDPFMGAGTTGLVARKLNRGYIGCELNQEYIKIAENRIFNEIGLF